MDHQKIIRLRHQAADARELQEKVYVRPDDLDALLDIACDRLDEKGV